MKDSEIKILGISGIENIQDLRCQVLIDSSLIGVYSFADSNFPICTIKTQSTGNIHISIENLKTSRVIGTSVLNINSLPSNGKIWVPLFPLKSSVDSSMKLCVYSTLASDLSLVIEQSSAESSFTSHPHIERVSFNRPTEGSSKEPYETLYKQEKCQRGHFEQQICHSTTQVNQLITAQLTRESELLTEISARDQQITSLQANIHTLQDQNRNLSLQLSTLTERASLFPPNSSAETSEKLKQLLESFEESEFHRKLLQEQLETVPCTAHSTADEQRISALKSELSMTKEKLNLTRMECVKLENLLEEKEIDRFSPLEEQTKETQKLRKLLKERTAEIQKLKENEVLTDRTNLASKPSVDEIFQFLLRKHCLQDNFIRITKGVYSFSNRTVSISQKSNALVCRVGSDFMKSDFFFSHYIKTIEDSHKRVSSVEPPTVPGLQSKEDLSPRRQLNHSICSQFTKKLQTDSHNSVNT